MARRIKTLDALSDYTLRQLGAPSIQVEITPEQIEDNIYKAIEYFAYYAMDGTEDRILLVEIDKGAGDYQLDDRIMSIQNVRTTSNFSSLYRLPGGYVFANQPMGLSLLSNINSVDVTNMSMYLSKLSMLQNMFDIPINYEYNEMTGIFRLFENPRESMAMLTVSLEYEPKEVDKIFGDKWIKSYVEALCKVTWGQVVGKYSSTLINGSTINYDRILSEGLEQKEKLEEELKDAYMEPLGITVG